MTDYFNQLERDWYLTRVDGATAQTPIGQIKRTYWISQLGATASNYGSGDLESRWLLKVIRDAGDTPSNEKSMATLWKEAVVAIGKEPTPRMKENQMIFYRNAS